MIEDASSMMYVKYNIKMDFVTIVFHNKTEYELLKLQALSFAYVDTALIHRILIVFNDIHQHKNAFQTLFFQDIYPYYPEQVKPLIQIVFLNELKFTFDKSDWFSQQAIKLAISKKIKTKYYVVLDAKNHFIQPITLSYFFNHNKPILYYNLNENDVLFSFYTNCLNYFNVRCPNPYNENQAHPKYKMKYNIQTITPYLFITNQCLELIQYIEKREKISLYELFKTEKYTEFYLYYAYLIFTQKHTLYDFKTSWMPILTIGPENPTEYIFNRWEHKAEILENYEIQVMALHRYCIYVLDDEYKEHLRQFYQNIYGERGVQLLTAFFTL